MFCCTYMLRTHGPAELWPIRHIPVFQDVSPGFVHSLALICSVPVFTLKILGRWTRLTSFLGFILCENLGKPLWCCSGWQSQPEMMEPKSLGRIRFGGTKSWSFMVHCFMHSSCCDHCWTINGEVIEHARKELIILRTALQLACRADQAIYFYRDTHNSWILETVHLSQGWIYEGVSIQRLTFGTLPESEVLPQFVWASVKCTIERFACIPFSRLSLVQE